MMRASIPRELSHSQAAIGRIRASRCLLSWPWRWRDGTRRSLEEAEGVVVVGRERMPRFMICEKMSIVKNDEECLLFVCG